MTITQIKQWLRFVREHEATIDAAEKEEKRISKLLEEARKRATAELAGIAKELGYPSSSGTGGTYLQYEERGKTHLAARYTSTGALRRELERRLGAAVLDLDGVTSPSPGEEP